MERMHTTLGNNVIPHSLVFLLVLGVLTAFGGVGDAPRKRGHPARGDDSGSGWAGYALAVGGTGTAHRQTLCRRPVHPRQRLRAGFPCWPRGIRSATIACLIRSSCAGRPLPPRQRADGGGRRRSLLRYGRVNVRGKQLFQRVEGGEGTRPLHTVQLRLQGKTALVLPLLGGRDLSEGGAGGGWEGQIRTHIARAPSSSRTPARPCQAGAFRAVQARPEPPNGYGGGKTTWVDTLLFLYIPDDSVRMAALESGDVDITWGTHEAYDRLKAHPDLKVQIEKPGQQVCHHAEHAEGIVTNVKVRQAALAALDMEPMLRAAVGQSPVLRLDSSLSFKEEPWWTDAEGNCITKTIRKKARRLLKEAGYQGEPVRYMAAHDAVAQHRGRPGDEAAAGGRGIHRRAAADGLEHTRATSDQPRPVGCPYHLVVHRHGSDTPPAVSAATTQDGIVIPTLPSCCKPWRRSCSSNGAIGSGKDIHRLFWDRVPFIQYGDTFWLTVMRKHVHEAGLTCPCGTSWICVVGPIGIADGREVRARRTARRDRWPRPFREGMLPSSPAMKPEGSL